MTSVTCDVLVLGAGPGGYPAAIRAAQLGFSTVCVEREKLGGVCLNWGCIPSKALLKTAELAHKIRHADEFGLSTGPLTIDFAKVIARSRGVSSRFEKGIGHLFKKYGVQTVSGDARLLGGGAVAVSAADGSTTTVHAKHIIVAVGARARSFPTIQPDGERILTYRDAVTLDRKPSSAILLGAGAIGMEFAYFWNAMGVSVTLLEGQDEVLPIEDREAGQQARKAFEKQGITVQTGVQVSGVARDSDEVVVSLADGRTLRADTVLVALGITPNTEAIGLDAAGVTTNARGFIQVDRSHRTSAAGIYAVGDCCDGGPALAHVATRQAHVCVERLAGLHVPDVDYGNVPSCTYSQPQVASVGRTEEALKKSGVSYQIGKFAFAANGRSQGAGTPEGWVKVLVDPKHGEILGAHIVGADATELLAEIVVARGAESDVETLLHTMHAHPTASEAVLEAVAVARGASVHA
jgi:dihydrolipoamide dehydrogenase